MKKIIILIMLLVVSSVNAQLADSPWPMYHGGHKHGGQSSVDTSHVNGFVKWTFEAGGAIETSPVIGEDGTIYFGAHDNRLYAVNPDGIEKWNFYVGEPVYDDIFDVQKGILSTPAVAKDGTIYFSSLSDLFFALNPDGSEKWRHELPITSDTWTSPVIGKDGTIYIGSARRKLEGSKTHEYFDPPIGGLYAFDPDGTLKWHVVAQSDMAGSPAIGDDGTIYAFIAEGKVEADGYLKAISPDGKEIWKYHSIFSESSPSIADDGTIYFGLGGKVQGFTVGLVALSPDGKRKWFFPTSNDISLIPAIANDGTIYAGEWDGKFYAFSPDGTVKWDFDVPKGYESLISSPAIGAEGTIYFGATDGLHALNPDGTERWHYQRDIGSVVSSPAIGKDGTIYVGSWNNKLYAFGEGEIEGDISEAPAVESEGKSTCPDGIWDEREQANPKICPLDNPNLDEYERRLAEESVRDEPCLDCGPWEGEMGEEGRTGEGTPGHEEPRYERSFFARIIDWFIGLFR